MCGHAAKSEPADNAAPIYEFWGIFSGHWIRCGRQAKYRRSESAIRTDTHSGNVIHDIRLRQLWIANHRRALLFLPFPLSFFFFVPLKSIHISSIFVPLEPSPLNPPPVNLIGTESYGSMLEEKKKMSSKFRFYFRSCVSCLWNLKGIGLHVLYVEAWATNI